MTANFPFYFVEAKVTHLAADQLQQEEHIALGTPNEDDGETLPVKKKKSKAKKRSKKEEKVESGNIEASEENGGKKLKSKKSSKRLKQEDLDDELRFR